MPSCETCRWASSQADAPAGHKFCFNGPAKVDSARNAPAWPWVEPQHTCGLHDAAPVAKPAGARVKGAPAAKRKGKRR